jgi:hypothetical protein
MDSSTVAGLLGKVVHVFVVLTFDTSNGFAI